MVTKLNIIQNGKSASFDIEENSDGSFILASDYEAMKAERDALEQRVNALAVENAGLKSKAAELVHEASEVYSAYNATVREQDGDFMDMQTLHEMQCIETPATDAALAALRLQGVEMFADMCREKSKTTTYPDDSSNWSLCGVHASNFAAELREAK